MSFSEPTLLIVGAGASAELDFPTGDALKDLIRACTSVKFDGWELVGTDREFCRLLEDLARPRGGNLEPILKACEHIRRNVVLSRSIDQFLSSHQAEEMVVACAKLAIAYQIALAERKSHLNDNKSGHESCDFAHIKDSWFPRLWSHLQNGQPIALWANFFDNLRVISFNYDRCLEQFLALALNGFCRVPIDEARAFAERLPILHVYGDLGSIDRQSNVYCPFAPERAPIVDAASRILTFSETVQENVREQIKDYLSWSSRVISLGFSYANPNMDLFPELANQHWVIGTAFDMSASNMQVARRALDAKLCQGSKTTILSSVKCSELLDNFDLSLR